MKKSLCIALFTILAIAAHGISTQARKKKNAIQIEELVENDEGHAFYRGQLVHSLPSQIM